LVVSRAGGRGLSWPVFNLLNIQRKNQNIGFPGKSGNGFAIHFKPRQPEKLRRCLFFPDSACGRAMMGKTVEKPKKHIISCRIDDKEMDHLRKIAHQSGTSISGLLRKTLTMLAQNQR
jgi:hypothetical protein